MGDEINFSEKVYIWKRLLKSKLQSIPFYLCRIFSIKKKKIVFCCIEGTTGYTCNPKYIAREFIKRKGGFQLVWLVNDTTKKFPKGIEVKKNTLWSRAYHLTTAKIWIDNSRKQLECRKRKGQIYIQTWHAKLGFKPTCLDRGKSFSRIAYLVSKHDSDMVDYWLSNSEWYDRTLATGSLYNGKVLHTGSPRCDVLVNRTIEQCRKVRYKYSLPEYAKIIIYAPTFRGGSQGMNRTVQTDNGELDYGRLVRNLEKSFGGKWYLFLRLHPQLVARQIRQKVANGGANGRIIDISKIDDIYQILAGCDALITDYSSLAFDAAVMEIPVFLYCNDFKQYQEERGSLLWDLKKLPFGLAQDNDELEITVESFHNDEYKSGLHNLFEDAKMSEDGKASQRVVDFIEQVIKQ